MAGGKLVITRRNGRPSPATKPSSSATPACTAPPVASLYAAGTAGERFAVRNLRLAVMEGTGDHCCEYDRRFVRLLGETGSTLAQA